MDRRRIAGIAAALALVVTVLGIQAWLGRVPDPVTRIAFGSCNTPEYAQPIWRPVLEAAPDVWIWAGDNIYADSEDVRRHRALYARQKGQPEYALLRQRAAVIGTWDDHDYGANNAGSEYPSKAESQKALLDFLDVPADDPRRHRAGVYSSHVYGPPGKRLRIILLDTRYHRDSYGPDGDMLGAAQWRWLETELQSPDSDLILLVSSVAVLMQGPKHTEGWYLFPKARQRLLRAISTAAAPVVLLSGDRHFAEISRAESDGAQWPVYEVMSSGMTHAGGGRRYPNPHRVGQPYTALNFGVLSIDWAQNGIAVEMQIRNAEGLPRITAEESYQRLSGTMH